jgi:prophage antirepressor-like protein
MTATPVSLPGPLSRARCLVGDDGVQRWVLADVCRIIGYGSPAAAARHLRGGHAFARLEGRRAAVIDEPRLYFLLHRVRVPATAAYRDFVFGELMPSLVRHGCYPPPTSCSRQTAVLSPTDAFRDALSRVGSRSRQ